MTCHECHPICSWDFVSWMTRLWLRAKSSASSVVVCSALHSRDTADVHNSERISPAPAVGRNSRRTHGHQHDGSGDFPSFLRIRGAIWFRHWRSKCCRLCQLALMAEGQLVWVLFVSTAAELHDPCPRALWCLPHAAWATAWPQRHPSFASWTRLKIVGYVHAFGECKEVWRHAVPASRPVESLYSSFRIIACFSCSLCGQGAGGTIAAVQVACRVQGDIWRDQVHWLASCTVSGGESQLHCQFSTARQTMMPHEKFLLWWQMTFMQMTCKAKH